MTEDANDRCIDHSDACQARQADESDGTRAAQPEVRIADRIRHHPMFSASDLQYLRAKGYSDEEVLVFWDRDHKRGCEPVRHNVAYSGPVAEVLHSVIRDVLSPQAVAVIAECLQMRMPIADAKLDSEVGWFASELVEMLGGTEPFDRIREEIGL